MIVDFYDNFAYMSKSSSCFYFWVTKEYYARIIALRFSLTSRFKNIIIITKLHHIQYPVTHKQRMSLLGLQYAEHNNICVTNSDLIINIHPVYNNQLSCNKIMEKATTILIQARTPLNSIWTRFLFIYIHYSIFVISIMFSNF